MYVADHGVGELMVKLRMLTDAPVPSPSSRAAAAWISPAYTPSISAATPRA